MSKKKKIIRIQKYTLTLTEYDNGTSQIERVADGIGGLELLGFLLLTTDDIMKQMRGKSKLPTVVKKKAIIRE